MPCGVVFGNNRKVGGGGLCVAQMRMQSGEDALVDALVRISKQAHAAARGGGPSAYADLMTSASKRVDAMLLARVVAPVVTQSDASAEQACEEMCALISVIEHNRSVATSMEESDALMQLHEELADVCISELKSLGL